MLKIKAQTTNSTLRPPVSADNSAINVRVNQLRTEILRSFTQAVDNSRCRDIPTIDRKPRGWEALVGNTSPRIHGCCTSAAGGNDRDRERGGEGGGDEKRKKFSHKGCRWWKKGSRVGWENEWRRMRSRGAPDNRRRRRRWRSVIVVTPLRSPRRIRTRTTRFFSPPVVCSLPRSFDRVLVRVRGQPVLYPRRRCSVHLGDGNDKDNQQCGSPAPRRCYTNLALSINPTECRQWFQLTGASFAQKISTFDKLDNWRQRRRTVDSVGPDTGDWYARDFARDSSRVIRWRLSPLLLTVNFNCQPRSIDRPSVRLTGDSQFVSATLGAIRRNDMATPGNAGGIISARTPRLIWDTRSNMFRGLTSLLKL